MECWNGILECLIIQLFFSLDLCAEEGGKNVELVPGGRNMEVTESNVYDYVRRYAEFRMVRSQYKSLEELRNGVLDVIPTTSLEGMRIYTS
jgi:E3 ubiquitin-protein ligase EDD1